MYAAINFFEKPMSASGSLGVAEQVLRSQDLDGKAFISSGNWTLIAGNNAITVTVVGVARAAGTWTVVSASAEEEALAYQARDVVIQGMIENAPAP